MVQGLRDLRGLLPDGGLGQRRSGEPLREGYRERGIGKRLIHEIIDEGYKAGLHTVIARITEDNDVSIHLHESVGFRHIGTMKEVGRKFGKFLDVNLMQLIYNQ